MLGEVRMPGCTLCRANRRSLRPSPWRRHHAHIDLAKVKVYQRGNVRLQRSAHRRRSVLFEGEVVKPAGGGGQHRLRATLDAGGRSLCWARCEPGAYPVEPGRQPRLMELIARADGDAAIALARLRSMTAAIFATLREAPIGRGDVLFEARRRKTRWWRWKRLSSTYPGATSE